MQIMQMQTMQVIVIYIQIIAQRVLKDIIKGKYKHSIINNRGQIQYINNIRQGKNGQTIVIQMTIGHIIQHTNE